MLQDAFIQHSGRHFRLSAASQHDDSSESFDSLLLHAVGVRGRRHSGSWCHSCTELWSQTRSACHREVTPAQPSRMHCGTCNILGRLWAEAFTHQPHPSPSAEARQATVETSRDRSRLVEIVVETGRDRSRPVNSSRNERFKH